MFQITVVNLISKKLS